MLRGDTSSERRRKGQREKKTHTKKNGSIPLLTCIKDGWIPDSTGFYTVLLGFHRNRAYF